jgi:hypothetical protein
MTADHAREWVRALTTAGWLFLLGYLAILAYSIDRARRITQSQFAGGIWSQRMEVLSFASIPQHLVVLVPAAAAGIAAAVLVERDDGFRDIWLDRLIRLVAGTAVAAAVIAVVGVLWVTFGGDDDTGDFGFVVSRLGGVAVGVAIVRVCLVAERAGQAPSSPSRK